MPGSSRAVQRTEGNVPVGMHSIVLDLSRLSRGTYSLEVTVNRMRAAGGAVETLDSVSGMSRSLVLR